MVQVLAARSLTLLKIHGSLLLALQTPRVAGLALTIQQRQLWSFHALDSVEEPFAGPSPIEP